MKIKSINIGDITEYEFKPGKKQLTGFFKKPIDSDTIQVNMSGLEGDMRAVRKLIKWAAVSAFPEENHDFWMRQLIKHGVDHGRKTFEYGFFSENLSISGLSDDEIYGGDKIKIGEAVLEVTVPRIPCFKFGAVMGYKGAILDMLTYSKSGFYMEVLSPGIISTHDEISIIPGPRTMSIADVAKERLTTKLEMPPFQGKYFHEINN
tara:strand:+ start:183 stop:800 length:618 start_codon:yes stop_codon:yes gene_type:complete